MPGVAFVKTEFNMGTTPFNWFPNNDNRVKLDNKDISLFVFIYVLKIVSKENFKKKPKLKK